MENKALLADAAASRGLQVASVSELGGMLANASSILTSPSSYETRTLSDFSDDCHSSAELDFFSADESDESDSDNSDADPEVNKLIVSKRSIFVNLYLWPA